MFKFNINFFKKTGYCEISHTIHSKPYIVGLYTTVINSHLHMMYCNLIFKKPYHEAISRTFLFISVGFPLFILVQFSVYSLVPAHFHVSLVMRVWDLGSVLGFGFCFDFAPIIQGVIKIPLKLHLLYTCIF